MSEYVDFHYMPLEGKITGKQVLKQTEDAINDLGNKVYNLDIDQSEIDEAIEKSNEAINTANSALSAVTTGRSVWLNNVAEMVATDIEAGVTAETKGYYVANDGGNALYLIRQEKSGDVVDGGSLIALDNGNMAELVTDGTVNVKQFGAIGNGTDDDTTAFQNTSAYAQSNGFVPFVGVATYKITSNITGTFNSFGEVTITGGGTVDIINLQEVVSDVSDIRDEVVDETASAKAYSESAATSATNASNSASSASTTATQLIEYLETKEELTAPAVDPTLSFSGAAADAKVTGNYVKTVVQENESFNLFDGNFDQNGYYINPSTGVITSGASFKCTSTFYPTNGATELYLLLSVSSNPCTLVFYKSDKTTVSGYVGMGADTSVYCSVPADTAYFRLFTNLSFDGTLCVSKKYTDTYVAYGKTYTVKDSVIGVDNLASDVKAQIGTVVETSNSNNLFDGNFGKNKYYINPTTGVDVASNSYKCTADFYPINGATTLYFLLSVAFNPCTFVFYESDKSTVTGYYGLGSSTKGMSPVPANTAYFRLYTDINFAGTLCVTSEYTDVYIPYQTTYQLKSNVVGIDNLSNNIINLANLVDGILDDTYLNYATGAMSSFSTYRCSELIPVSASTEYIVGVYNDVNAPTYEYHNISICYYNANGTFISGAISYAGSDGGVNLTRKNNLLYITTPASCAYIRMGLNDSENPHKWYVGLSNSYNNYVDKSIKESAVGIQSNLCGKTIVCFGDSIIGNTRDETSTPFYVSLACGASVINCGFGGCRMSVHSGNWNLCSMYSLADDIYNEDFTELASAISTGWDGMQGYFRTTIKFLEDVDFDTVDAVVISYGTNDYRGGEYPLDDSNNKFNTSTICGALRYSIKQILSKYPHIQILVTDPIIRFFFYDGTYNVEFDSDTKDWGNGTLLQYSEAYKQACKEMKVQFLDLYNTCGINQYNRLGYFDADDGTHPNANGRERIGTLIGNKLKEMLKSK